MPDVGDTEARHSRRALLQAGLGIAATLALYRSASVQAAAAEARQSTEHSVSHGPRSGNRTSRCTC